MFTSISPISTHNVFRRRRIALLNGLVGETLAENAQCHILDLGGTAEFWETWSDMIDWDRVSVTCVNLGSVQRNAENDRVKVIYGNACCLDQINDNSFDIVFSNSVIEHVGMWSDMVAMAGEVSRAAPRYLVQTPYFWFPIEPHARTPFLHWLPESIAYRIVMNFKCGFWSKAESVEQAVLTVQSARLIDHQQMLALFPDASILKERFFGVTKSLIAIRSHYPQT